MPTELLPPLPGMLLRAVATLRRGYRGSLPGQALAASYAIGAVDLERVARYRQVIDDHGTHLPLAYFYLLAQRAQLALMLDSRFPFPVPGLIHGGNAMRLLGTPRAGAGLEAHVSVVPQGNAGTSRGITFTVDLTQSGRNLISCTSDYRLRRPGRRRLAPDSPATPMAVPPAAASREFTAALSRRYALVAGDYNPIHLSSLAARAFGLPSAVAHGMLVVAWSAAAIERARGGQVTAMTARFRRPIRLPGRADLAFEAAAGDRGRFQVISPGGQAPNIEGTWVLD